ncbi:hypothetical protein D3C73_1445550 [compost metagenome]
MFPARHQDDDGLRLGKTAEVLKVAVLPVDVLDVAIADRHGGGRQDCDTVGFHLRHQRLAATGVFRFRDMDHGQVEVPCRRISAEKAWQRVPPCWSR